MTAKQIIFNLVLQYGGSWEKICDAIKNKTQPSVVADESDDWHSFLNILDEEYPSKFKELHQPPFGIFYRGNLSLFNNDLRKVFVSCDNPSTNKYNQLIKDIGSKYVLVFTYTENLINRIKLLEGPIIVWSHVPLQSMDQTVVQTIIDRNGLIITEYPGQTGFQVKVDTRQKMTTVRAASSSDYTLVIEAQDKKELGYIVNATVTTGGVLGCVPQDISTLSLNNDLLSEGAVCITTVNHIASDLD